MSIQDWAAAGGLMLAMVSAGITAVWALIKEIRKMAREQGQVEFMARETWNALMQRALAEGVIAGDINLTLLSQSPDFSIPFVVTEQAKERFIRLGGELIDELRQAYHNEWAELDDNALALVVNARFGQLILKQICLPSKMTHFRCLLIACAVMRGDRAHAHMNY